MPSLKVIRTIVDHSNGSKKEQTIVEIWHKHQQTVYNLYNLLLANEALEGGDTIIYKEKQETQKYHLCMICRKRAIENVTQVHCSTCAKPNIKTVSLPLDQALIEEAKKVTKPKQDNSKYYKY